jgi:hypothetical protein
VSSTLIIDTPLVVLLKNVELSCLYKGMKAAEVGVRVVRVLTTRPIHCRRPIHLNLSSSGTRRIGVVGDVVQLKKGLTTIGSADSGALLYEVSREAIDSTLGKSLATGLARMLVSVTGVVQFCTSSEMLKDQSCRIISAEGLHNQKLRNVTEVPC